MKYKLTITNYELQTSNSRRTNSPFMDLEVSAPPLTKVPFRGFRGIKLQIFLFLFFSFTFANLQAAFLKDIPMQVTQPNGVVLHCFATGDEYFNYLHDKDGFTIIQHSETGYYMYAIYSDNKIIPSGYIAGTVDPAEVGLIPNVRVSVDEYQKRKAEWFNFNQIDHPKTPGRNHGAMNNLSVFIRFSDESEVTTNAITVDNMFNSQNAGFNSMYNYFKATSYGHLTISTSFYPQPSGTQIISYQDIHPRSYYMPYNASSNPNGYQDSERTEREHQLLKRAVEFVASMVPTSLNIDYNNDGYVDNVCFVIKGNTTAWSTLLWPHRWSLYSESAYINGKRVYDYNFMLEGASGYFNTAVLSHEMQHSLSYPDLYHYYTSGPTPVGNWDIMESNPNPPQQSGAHMKWKYGNWVNEPTVIQPGKYTLNSVGSGKGFVSYKIPTSNPKQHFVLEFRRTADAFENHYGTGLLIYRINTNFNGNAEYNATSIFDEVYIFRPGGNSPTQNGTINTAHFGTGGRNTFNATTNPKPFLSEGTMITDFEISDITIVGDQVTFVYNQGATVYHSIIFDANGGEGAMNPQMFASGVAQNLSANTFTNTTLVFKGWATSPTGDVVYQNNESVAIIQEVTLFAVWDNVPPPVYFAITATVITTDGLGTISPVGNIQVLKNTNQTFVIKAGERDEVYAYFIQHLLIDGLNVSLLDNFEMEYTFENVTENHTIEAVFTHNVSIDELENIINFTVTPNPTNSFFEIKITNYELLEKSPSGDLGVRIYDIHGKLLMQIPIMNEITKVDASTLARGIYFVKVGGLAKKIVISD